MSPSATGCYGSILSSSDGFNWLVQTLNTNQDYEINLTDVAFGNGRFVAVGDVIITSTDGTNWVVNTNFSASAVTSGNGTFVIGAQGGAILQSDPLVNLSLTMQSAPQLLLTGPVNRSYRIEYCDGLQPAGAWNLLATVQATNMPVTIGDVTCTNRPSRFYRALLLP